VFFEVLGTKTMSLFDKQHLTIPFFSTQQLATI